MAMVNQWSQKRRPKAMTTDSTDPLKCPRCGDLDGNHIGTCRLRRPIFADQHLSPAEADYVRRVQARRGETAV